MPYLDSSEQREPTAQEKNYQHQLIRWGRSLNIARTLFNFRMLGGDLEFACFNNLANTWGQNVIECSKEGAYLSANGRVFEFLSRSAARWPVRVETREKPVDGTAVWACLTADKHGVVVSCLNELSTPWLVTIDLSALGLSGEKSGKLMSLLASDRTAHVTLPTQDVIKHVERNVPVNASGTMVIEVPPCSVSELTVP